MLGFLNQAKTSILDRGINVNYDNFVIYFTTTPILGEAFFHPGGDHDSFIVVNITAHSDSYWWWDIMPATIIHEIGHAYHEHQLGGIQTNQEINDLYNNATWNDDSQQYYKANVGEFFAVVFTEYVWGGYTGVSRPADEAYYRDVLLPWLNNLFN